MPTNSSAPNRHTSRSFFTHAVLLATTLSAANLTLQISTETAPPNGTAQFKISVTTPALISTAALSITFDPTIFGPVSNVAALTATGDQIGYANVNGQQITASVSSASASSGQLPSLPIFVVTVPILASAKIGTTSSITVDPTPSPWQDQQGNTYTVAINPGTFTVGGTLSVASVIPGGGLLPQGTIVEINGTGFDAATTVTIDGVSIASTHFVNPQQMIVILGGATQLDAKHVHLKTGAGEQTDFFSALPSSPANAPPTVFPLMPLTTYANVCWDVPDSPDYSESIALLNQNLVPVNVTFFSTDSHQVATVTSEMIPPGELYLYNPGIFDPSGVNSLCMLSPTPMRMLEYRVNYPFPPASAPEMSVFPPRPMTAYDSARLQPTAQPPAPWTWQIGTPAPSSENIFMTGGVFPFTAASSVPWLSVSPTQGTVPASLALTPNVSALGAGSYSGTVTLHTILPPSLAVVSVPDIVIPVSIQVSASPFIKAIGSGYFTATPGSTTPIAETVAVSSSGTPAQFSVSVNAPWLTASPTTGSTPGSITLTANPSGLAAGTYMGSIVVEGPANSVTIPEELVIAPAPVQPTPLSVNPSSLTFALSAGSPAPLSSQLIFVQPTFNFTIAVATRTGGNWLTAVFEGGVAVNASAVGLNPGTYQGTITLTSPNNGSVQIPVTLVVLVPAAPLTVTPSTVSLTLQAGQTVTQTFTVTSTPSTLYSYSTFVPGSNFGPGGSASSPYTPATVQLGFTSAQPGTNYSSVTFTSGSGSVVVPIVLNVTASPTFPPILASVVNAASGLPSALSPGEIISLYGTGLSSQVLIDNIAAPVIYASSSQVNAIVPFEVSGTVTVQDWAIPLAPSAPGIFAIENQDGSVNSPSNPAARGTEIQIFATGGGQTSPPSSTGTVAQTAASLTLPVTVTIGGANAQVLYAGNAPGEIEGLVQINVIVPPTAPSSDVQINIGGIASQVYLLTLPDPPPLTKSSTSPRVNRQ